MNPLKWKTQEKYATAILMLIGANFGVIVGYFVYSTAYGSDGSRVFTDWLFESYYHTYLWPIYGAIIAFALVYSKKLFNAS